MAFAQMALKVGEIRIAHFMVQGCLSMNMRTNYLQVFFIQLKDTFNINNT